ncbi:MAG: PilZ domain-containing protein [Deltaproteobacteria bacterium]|nr:PilZ domain-containing protein [Deltaproteobacteria bacterium]
MDTRVVLVAREGEARNAYIREIRRCGVHVDTVSSFQDLRRMMTEVPYNGVLVDLETKIKAPANEKRISHEILSVFPVVQLRNDGKTDSVRTLYFGQLHGEKGTLENFLDVECRSFPPRTIRSNIRRDVYLNVLLSRKGDFSQKTASRSVTLNVSQGGCFIYSTEKWERAWTASFIIKALDDAMPITGEVRWTIPWGATMRLPGIGVRFQDIRHGQLEEIRGKCYR